MTATAAQAVECRQVPTGDGGRRAPPSPEARGRAWCPSHAFHTALGGVVGRVKEQVCRARKRCRQHLVAGEVQSDERALWPRRTRQVDSGPHGEVRALAVGLTLDAT